MAVLPPYTRSIRSTSLVAITPTDETPLLSTSFFPKISTRPLYSAITIASPLPLSEWLEVDRDRRDYVLHFDVESSLLVQIGYKTWLPDDREVDGVKVPSRIDARFAMF
jgi:hypothetical protein